MKKILLFLAVSFCAISMNAQNVFQNPGFENWTGTLTLNPSNWNSLGILGANLCNISRSTESHTGDYAVSVGAKQLPSSVATMLGIPQTTVPGLLTNATIDMTALLNLFTTNSTDLTLEQVMTIFTDGAPLTQKPTSVNGYYSWNPIDENNESFLLYTFVVSNVSGTREVVGVSIYSPLIPAKATYTSFESPITYINEVSTPTELIFLVQTSSLDTTATTFGNLLLDDLYITSTVGLKEINNKDNSFVIYPNPTKGEFRLNVKSQVEVSVYNQLGQVVVNPMTYSPNQTIKIKKNGVYFVRVNDGSGYKTKKLIVK